MDEFFWIFSEIMRHYIWKLVLLDSFLMKKYDITDVPENETANELFFVGTGFTRESDMISVCQKS